MVADKTRVQIWVKDIKMVIEYTFDTYEEAMQFIATVKDHETASTLPIQYLIQEEL